MSSQIPLRIRQAIRDQVESRSSKLFTKTSVIKELLGYPVNFDPEWGMLWESLQPHYPDSSTFVPTIANIVIAWCEAFASWLENADSKTDAATDVDRFVEEINDVGKVQLILELSLSISRPLTSWDSTRKLFTISIPVSQYTQPAQAGFAGDFFSLFNSSKVVRESEDADAWADLGSDSSPVTAGKIEATDAFPDISTVERPEVLSLKPPYWLQIRQEDYSTITVTASHGPSLGFIEAYLKKWCRGNVNLVNRPPLVTITLRESAFGLGLMHDRLVLESSGRADINVRLLLVLVESVLGYHDLGRPGPQVWEFKRVRAFQERPPISYRA